MDDKRLLKLIRRYLEAGVMADGVRQPTEEGTPPGSPLSPLLSNIMLTTSTGSFSGAGTGFVRYAHHSMVYVRRERAAERVITSLSQFVEQTPEAERQRREIGGSPSVRAGRRSMR
ncbi:MAG: RNA-directed polymerase [Miltoncostaeaceae bacterium]|nr:RNA-directed polymerase [Miltoncostaeaceae bacterium]